MKCRCRLRFSLSFPSFTGGFTFIFRVRWKKFMLHEHVLCCSFSIFLALTSTSSVNKKKGEAIETKQHAIYIMQDYVETLNLISEKIKVSTSVQKKTFLYAKKCIRSWYETEERVERNVRESLKSTSEKTKVKHIHEWARWQTKRLDAMKTETLCFRETFHVVLGQVHRPFNFFRSDFVWWEMQQSGEKNF